METVIRVAVVYVFLMAGLRFLGKREFGQLSPFDLVVLLMIPELVSQSLVREDFSLTNAIIGVSTLMTLVFMTSLLSHRFPKVDKVISGEAAVLVQHGALVPEAMNRERVNPGEVMEAVFTAGLEAMEQVKWAILGTDGRISVIPWQPGETTPRPERPDAL